MAVSRRIRQFRFLKHGNKIFYYDMPGSMSTLRGMSRSHGCQIRLLREWCDHKEVSRHRRQSRSPSVGLRHNQPTQRQAVRVLDLRRQNELPDDLKDAGKLYGKVFEWITSEALCRETTSETSRVVVVTDDIPKEAKKKQVIKPLKKLLKDFSQRTGIPAHLEHFPSESDFNLQIADYLCWAFMRKAAHDQDWPYSKVESIFAETGCLTT